MLLISFMVESQQSYLIVRGCAGRLVLHVRRKTVIPTTCATHGGSGRGTSRWVPLSTHTQTRTGSHVDHISHETQALTANTGEGALGSGGGGGGGGAQRGCAARATEGRVGKTARRGRRRRRRRQRARGARDGGAEQRPLARPLLRLCQGRALCAAAERARQGKGHAWRRGTRGGGGEQPSER